MVFYYSIRLLCYIKNSLGWLTVQQWLSVLHWGSGEPNSGSVHKPRFLNRPNVAWKACRIPTGFLVFHSGRLKKPGPDISQGWFSLRRHCSRSENQRQAGPISYLFLTWPPVGKCSCSGRGHLSVNLFWKYLSGPSRWGPLGWYPGQSSEQTWYNVPEEPF